MGLNWELTSLKSRARQLNPGKRKLIRIFRFEVQKGQRVALIGIAEKQNGHSLVVGAEAGASAFFFILLIQRMTRKRPGR
jgi:hypothetical protein